MIGDWRLEIRDWRHLEIRDSDYWLLCNEIATARQGGPRNDKTKSLEFVEFIEFVGFIEIGVIRSSMRPPRPPLFPFSVTLVSFELSGTSRIGFFCP